NVHYSCTYSDDPVLSMRVQVGHSPDPDDAFMFYGFAKGAVKLDGYEFVEVVEDIESLNKRAMKSELEVTALSAHAYALVSEKYYVLSSGASMDAVMDLWSWLGNQFAPRS